MLRANKALQGQLASLSVLYASLAAQQFSDALVACGLGTDKRWLNARSIRVVSLHEATQPGPAGTIRSLGTFAVMVDELQVSEYLPPAQAQAACDSVASTLNRVLQPAG